MPNLLFLCNDFIGPSMAGPGIRTWELAHAYQRKGSVVAVLSRRCAPGFSSPRLAHTGTASIASLARWIRWADAVILTGRPADLFLTVLLRKRMVVDQYDPVIFELLAGRKDSSGAGPRQRLLVLLWKLRQRLLLRFGDAFLVANEKQKDLLLGQLAVLGHATKLESVTLLPFGLSDEAPVRSGTAFLRGKKVAEEDFLLVWGGGIWDWFDPFTLLRALAKVRPLRRDVKVFFPGLRPPNPDAARMAVADEFLARARELDLLDTMVVVNDGWTPYDRRAEYLLEADAGISLHKDSLETRFAFRTRMLDYLWAGLPVIASEGDDWAERIRSRGMGITVPCGDADAVAAAILRMADDRAFREQCRERVRAAAEQYRWGRLVETLDLAP